MNDCNYSQLANFECAIKEDHLVNITQQLTDITSGNIEFIIFRKDLLLISLALNIIIIEFCPQQINQWEKMVTSKTPAKAEQLADLTFKLLANCQEKEARLAEQYGLTQAEFRCLRLFGTNESSNNKQIAERMNLSPSRLTRIIDGLVIKNYMIREIDSDDRRNMKVTLSKQGIDITQKLNNAYIGIHKEILEDIDEAQHKPLITAMYHLLSALEKWLQKPE